MKCIKCSNEIPEGSNFCSICGTNQNAPLPDQIDQNVNNNNVNQNTINNQVKKINLNNKQKGIILSLLVIVVILLGVIAFSGDGSSILKKNKYNSRTVMIYMVGSNLETDVKAATADMASVDPSTIDLNKTNILIYTGGTKYWHNQVQNDENAIYKLTANGFEKIESYAKNNMADGKELTNFLNYSYENYKADQYNLILYDHGAAYVGAIKDDFTNDLTSLEEFDSALSKSSFNGRTAKLNSVSFRTCLMGSLEVAKTFSKYADYLVASEEEIYLGSSIHVFGDLFNNLDPSEDEVTFGKRFIEAYKTKMATTSLDYPITYSIVKLDEIDNLIDETNKFFKGIDIDTYYQDIIRARASIYQFPQDPDAHNEFDSIDLKSMVNVLAPTVNKSADAFNSAFEKAVVYNYSSVNGAEGLTLYFPYSSKIISGYANMFTYLKDYTTFYTNVYNSKKNSGGNSYKAGSASVNVESDGKVVEYELPEGVKENYRLTNYFLFRKNEEHPNYYYLVVNSTDTELDGNKVKIKIDDKMIYGINDDGVTGMYLPRVSRKNLNGVDNYSYVVAYLKEVNDKYNITGSSKAKITFDLKQSKPTINTIELDSRNETVAGLYDKDQIKSFDMYASQLRIFDSNGKLMDHDDWESSPQMLGYNMKFDDMELEYRGMDDGEWGVVFFVYDVNGNVYKSDFVKVGK